ncbi:TrmH family RNA methyltransferase [Dactylosporangium matsuzakiense]|uniref:TrmH family RNA methyltransferase n=1 Tax=Dactylosporangium matsuzakiense TaxID=53360 RepID=UPI0035F08C45
MPPPDPQSSSRPGVFTVRTPRVVAARRLHRRRDRDETGRFLAEGPQAVREAFRAGVVTELFATADAAARHPEWSASLVDDAAMEALADTVQPQGLVAVCRQRDVPLEQALARKPRLVAVCVDIRDPGNAGTVLRTADAAGAKTVIFAGDTVDPYNGKAVRSSAGSLFHVDIVRARDTAATIATLQAAGLQVLAADGYGKSDLFDLSDLHRPTAWLFGSEAHGLPRDLAVDLRVRVPLYGGAESLNLAAAAAVCLYSSAKAMRSVE